MTPRTPKSILSNPSEMDHLKPKPLRLMKDVNMNKKISYDNISF